MLPVIVNDVIRCNIVMKLTVNSIAGATTVWKLRGLAVTIPIDDARNFYLGATAPAKIEFGAFWP